MKKNTLINAGLGLGIAECRICGLKFVPDLDEDRELHEQQHRKIIWGGLPFGIREFLKDFGWSVAYHNGDVEQHGKWDSEAGKRAVVFGYWARAISNGIPENDFEPFMSAHFEWVDARVANNAERMDKAAKKIKRWQKYA